MGPVRLAFGLVLAAALAASACGRPKDPVAALLGDLEAAAEDRSAEGIRDRLTEDFRGADGVDRAGAYAEMRRYFAGYESVRIDVYDVKAVRDDAGADVHLRVDFTGSARRIGGLAAVLPPSASYVFELRAVPSGDAWKVQRAAWTAAEVPGASGP